MSRYNDEISLKEIISELFSQYNLNYGIDKIRTREAWVEIAGTGIVKYTDNVRLQVEKLFITLNNAALKENLSFRKSELAQLINDYLQKEVVKEIIFL